VLAKLGSYAPLRIERAKKANIHGQQKAYPLNHDCYSGETLVWQPDLDNVKIERRISDHPQRLGITNGGICPDFFETVTGDYVVIGKDITDRIDGQLPTDALVSNGERVILVPRVLIESVIRNMKST
jgi:hypothetical protein